MRFVTERLIPLPFAELPAFPALLFPSAASGVRTPGGVAAQAHGERPREPGQHPLGAPAGAGGAAGSFLGADARLEALSAGATDEVIKRHEAIMGGQW